MPRRRSLPMGLQQRSLSIFVRRTVSVSACLPCPRPTSARTENAHTAAALAEVRQKLPGVLDVLEPDHPGMHTTNSVDFNVVVFGEVVLELHDGAEVLLKAGDCDQE